MKKISCVRWFGLSRQSVLITALATIFIAFVMVGCSEKKANEKTENIVIRGSNTIGEELAPRLIAEYKKEHPTAVFDTEFKGTSYGFGALIAGNCDVAAASREANTNDLALARDNGVELKDYVIGSYSVAVIVNAGNSVTNLTTNQVRDIFTGTVQNWKEIGGPDAPIHLYIRSPISGTHLGFQEVAMEKKPYATHLKALTNNTEIIQAVSKDTNGIGYSNLHLTKSGGIKAISIGEVAPTFIAVTKGQYPYARVLHLYTSKTKEKSTAAEFARFVQSSRGQSILEEMGFAPKP